MDPLATNRLLALCRLGFEMIQDDPAQGGEVLGGIPTTGAGRVGLAA